MTDDDTEALRAEIDRLRSALEQRTTQWRALLNLRERDSRDYRNLKSRLSIVQAELKAAKSTRFENNGVGDVAMHIQAETINDLRLN
jgi:hypothetical protein